METERELQLEVAKILVKHFPNIGPLPKDNDPNFEVTHLSYTIVLPEPYEEHLPQVERTLRRLQRGKPKFKIFSSHLEDGYTFEVRVIKEQT